MTYPAVTNQQIRTLRAEAAEAGDLAQVAICDRAMDGDDAAAVECARVIAEAAAQGEPTKIETETMRLIKAAQAAGRWEAPIGWWGTARGSLEGMVTQDLEYLVNGC
jgi:hypothetical protein